MVGVVSPQLLTLALHFQPTQSTHCLPPACRTQVEVVNPELYMYDGEVIAKAEEMGKPGLVTIKQKQVGGLVRG